jgi:simple sugar transport system ATP-binding protein
MNDVSPGGNPESLSPLLAVRGLSTSFPGVLANDAVSFTLNRGETIGLLGENGAGKTSLVKALAGLVKPDQGEILVDGAATAIDSPLAARRVGIQMVHQHFSLCPQLTVLENVLLGSGLRLGRLHADDAEGKLRDLTERHGLSVDPRRLVSTLTVGERQIVEILKALSNDPKVLILDEPTAVLSAPETQALFAVIERLNAQGCGVILITHKLEELLRATKRIVVMRRGRVVDVFETATADVNVLARVMMGMERDAEPPHDLIQAAEVGLIEAVSPKDVPSTEGSTAVNSRRAQQQDGGKYARRREDSSDRGNDEQIALQLLSVSADGSDGHHAIYEASLTVRAGEIVGVAGIEGNGQSTLVGAVAGIAKVREGQVLIAGRDATRLPASARLASSVAIVPEDRHHQASVPHMTVTENLALALAGRPEFTKHGLVRWGTLRRRVNHLIAEYGVKATPGARFETLSGGNQQRLVLARELTKRPTVLLAAQPTRGLDVAGAAYVHRQLMQVAASGSGVLLISSDLDEILLLADTVVVLHRGQVVATVPRHQATRERLGLWMIGVQDDVETAAS